MIQIQQEMIDDNAADISQIINELNRNNLFATLLADALNDFFHDLNEILTEEILSDNDIIRLIQDQENENDENNNSEEK